MPFTFSSTEYANMVYIYWFCNENMSAAAKYQRQFPSQRISYHIFSNTFHKDCSAASFRDCETAVYFLAFQLLQNLRYETVWLKKKMFFK
jgi:hypothetical protein